MARKEGEDKPPAPPRTAHHAAGQPPSSPHGYEQQTHHLPPSRIDASQNQPRLEAQIRPETARTLTGSAATSQPSSTPLLRHNACPSPTRRPTSRATKATLPATNLLRGRCPGIHQPKPDTDAQAPPHQAPLLASHPRREDDASA
jgi:hypothetical protein